MINQTIAHFRITSKLGQGGMGEVYRATDTKLDREVAIKILPQEISDDPIRRKRFIKEAKAASALNHPHVCVIYEVNETEDGCPFIAMEFLPGQTLDLLPANKPLDDETVVEIGSQIADALDAANQAGIIHRDIKPANIHRDGRGRVKVLDFGLAKRIDQALSQGPQGTTLDMTEAGKLLGTPSYMSPEQTRCETLDHRTDLFSLGVLLYELTTGRLPFEGSSIAETVEKITHEQPEAIARFNYGVSPELERIIRKCLEKKPDHRYQSSRELLIDLKRLQRDSSTQEATLPEKRHSWKAFIALAGVAVLALVLLGIWWSQRDALPLEAFRHGKSVAVIPFKVQSEDMTIFAEGLCEGLANALGGVEQFDRIPPWSSSSSFRQESSNKRQMAETMQVSTILEGSIIQGAGNQMRISATLINPFSGRSGAVMWGGNYDHSQSTDLPFAIQDEITRSIVESLRLELEDDPARQFVKRYTKSPEAYDSYSKGRFFWKQRGAGLKKAERYFELALLFDSPTGSIEDSNMAPAYVGLADTFNMQAFYGMTPSRSAGERALRYVKKALEIDDQMAEAYAALAWLKLHAGDGGVGAAQAFEKAIELDDRLASARYWYGTYFFLTGDYENARKRALEALKIDPVSESTRTLAAMQLQGARYYEESLDILKDVLGDNPDFMLAHYVIGLTHTSMQRQEAGITSLGKAARLSGQQPFVMASLAYAHALAGNVDDARQILASLGSSVDRGVFIASQVAATALSLGEKETCYELLEQSLREYGSNPWLWHYDWFVTLRSEQRFIEIVERSGLLKYNEATQAFEVNGLTAEQKANQ